MNLVELLIVGAAHELLSQEREWWRWHIGNTAPVWLAALKVAGEKRVALPRKHGARFS